MSGFKMDMSGLIRGIAEREIKTKAAIALYGDTVAKKMETHAKSNYKWTPRSGAAHQRLNGTSKWYGPVVRVELSHGVDYGIYLEFCNEKKYAIIKPTIDFITPSAIRGLKKHYEIGVIMFKDIYVHLKNKDFDVYSIGQHEGICTEPYIVLKENGESEIAGTNLSNDVVELLIYYPIGSYSTLEDYCNSIKDNMKDLVKLRRVLDPSPVIIDDDKKAYMTSYYYRKIKQIRK